ncbi:MULTISPECIES: hypothetical protein [unclassified Massilia]|uniref:FimV/HubP-related protein n=1 Tax=unclassified Massilia TaxID=2609279 RepID=UPI00177E17BD|nr:MULTISPECIES: hypothetical protein [unclassified Massilia]MBD8531954.1 hypothetical protein [Massilia sp. CFBP 13647]MBD8675432.1 hypothetical protein [Massilia sp. CFBP 13721]
MALRTSHILTTLLLAGATAASHAAELGEARVLSHIGQALVADVELTLVEDPGTPVAVRLANADVYRGANIAMPPVLSSLDMRVTRRDGRQFLHLTSLKPVEGRHLHVYLELIDAGQRSVRLVTLWLTPDPNPISVPVPVSAPTPASAPAPAPAPLPLREAAIQPAVAQALARPAPARKPAPAPRPAAALQAGEEYVEEGGHPAVPIVRKSTPKPAPKPKVAPKPLHQARPSMAAPVEAPSCAPQVASAPLNACVALGEKNAALHHQLGQLEDKVKVLQASAGTALPQAEAGAAVTPPAAPEAAALAPTAKQTPKEAAKDAPKGAPRIHRKPKKPEPPQAETPWLLIGAGVAAVAAIAGLVLALLGRRKRSRFGKIPPEHKPAKLPKAAADGSPKPHFMAAVKARLMPGRAKAAPEAAAAAQAPEAPDEVVSQPQ